METNNQRMELSPGQCSYYESCKAKRNVVVTLAQFVTAIRGERWKRQVDDYRRLRAGGKAEEAARLKASLPAILVAGVCEGSHRKVDFRTFSGYLMVDIDGYKGDIHALLHRLKEQPWAAFGWVSVSGEGAKLVVRVDAVTMDDYERRAYPKVAAEVSRIIGHPVDMACRDLTRLCYASFDPDAFINQHPEPFDFSASSENSENSDFSDYSDYSENSENSEYSENSDPSGPSDPSEKSPDSGMLPRFLADFLESHPYVPKHRHRFHLALGREAYRFGMNREEVNRLAELAATKLAMPDCGADEIRCNILDSYKFGERKQLDRHPRRGSKGPWVHYVPFSGGAEAAGTDDGEEPSVADINHELRMDAPFLPDWIFDRLPAFFLEGLAVARNPRQRDMLFLAMTANLSACMPGVRMVYDDTDVYPHCFVTVIASSASGKGIMANAARLGEGIQKMLNTGYDEALAEYEKAQMLWEQERQRAMKEHREPDMKLRPEPVVRRTLMVPADVSRTQLIQLMSGSPDGVVLNVSEMDTLRTAVNADYGRFDDLMRACFHHEMFGTDFKQDKRPYMVWCPKMAFCASGTPSQFYHLCPSAENGAYSRYLIYMAEQEAGFRRMAPGGERQNKNRVFRHLSERTLEMYRFLKAHPTEVKFTPDQWDEHQSYFQSVLQDVVIEESTAPVSVVFRHGLNTARLAMVLTALRKFEEGWEFYELKCSEEDFRIAMAVMAVLLRHSLTLSTSLRKEDGAVGEMNAYFRVRRALEKLKSPFRYQDLIDSLLSEGMSRTTAKRVRLRLLKKQIIVQEGDAYRFINNRWRNHLDR